MTLRDQIEAGFERWGHLVFRHPLSALAFALVVTLGLASQLPKLEVDGSAEAFLHRTDPGMEGFTRLSILHTGCAITYLNNFVIHAVK